MAKRFGFSAAAASIAYIRDNVDVCYVAESGGATFSALNTANGNIVSANVSAADLTIACANQGPVLTVGQKPSQAVDGSGTANHAYLVNVSAARILYVTEITSLELASGGVVTLNSWTVTVNQTATNSS